MVEHPHKWGRCVAGMDIGTQTAKEVAHECRSRWNVEETGEDSWGIDLIYFHTESDFQVPWCMIWCNGTPL